MRIVHKKLKRENTVNTSGDNKRLIGRIPILKDNHYRIIKGISVGGDAPKDLLRVYEYKSGKKQIDKPSKWPIYIAKTGHKWYPHESITEFLLNRLGYCLDLNMAESKLYFVNGQIRFFSKLFRHDKHQLLEHGAELYWGYLGDRDFVEQVEADQRAREFFTISFTHETLKYIYPHQGEDIFIEFTKMLVFDAIIGNNDRHFYNWGVLKHLGNKHQPIFSPIYDTARALFWNRSEEHIKNISKDSNQMNQMLNNYIIRSRPKIGIEKKSDCNHFDIVKILYSNKFEGTKDVVNGLINTGNLKRCKELIYDEFQPLLSPVRVELVVKCISLRFEYLFKEIK
ncbi:MAG TPA: HipA domain-containing protein [Fulvivirga sp.]|nr:HipA domain-containing protein [Fulvivirga sp.]